MRNIIYTFVFAILSCGSNQGQMEEMTPTSSSIQRLEGDDSCRALFTEFYPIAGYYTLDDGTTISIWPEKGPKGDVLGVQIRKGQNTLGGYYRLGFSSGEDAYLQKDSMPSHLTSAGDTLHFFFRSGQLSIRSMVWGENNESANLYLGEVTKIDVNETKPCALLKCNDARGAFSASGQPCGSRLPTCGITQGTTCNNQEDSQSTVFTGWGWEALLERFTTASAQSCDPDTVSNFCKAISVSGVSCSPQPGSCQCICDF